MGLLALVLRTDYGQYWPALIIAGQLLDVSVMLFDTV